MIAAVTGAPGSGKSYMCVRTILEALWRGQCVATNVRLVDGWAEKCVRRQGGLRCWLPWYGPRRRRRLIDGLTSRYLYLDNLDDLLRVEVEPPEVKGWFRRGSDVLEGYWIAVLDEAHHWLNNRQWEQADRLTYGNWFAEHRKYGADVYLITQHLDSVDKQVRDRVEYHVTLRNLRRATFCGIPLCPFNVFLAIWVWAQGGTGRNRHVAKRRAYKLSWQRKLYDTHQRVHALARPDAIRLPHAIVSPGAVELVPDVIRTVAPEPPPVRRMFALPAGPEVTLWDDVPDGKRKRKRKRK